MKNRDELPTLTFASTSEWETWLESHQSESTGVWLKIAKKESGIPSISYAEALDGALCYGWIDGQKAPFDERFWLQKFTPRGRKSLWSKTNRQKALALLEEKRLRPAGLRQVELAQADGRWDAAYAGQSQMEVPGDFQSELDRRPQAREFFQTLNSANRYAVLFRIHTAKRAATRAARIQKLIDMLEKGEKIHP
jgi:uncharacterized protein YdeI (YjbR/CyaY-like superfamily)